MPLLSALAKAKDCVFLNTNAYMLQLGKCYYIKMHNIFIFSLFWYSVCVCCMYAHAKSLGLPISFTFSVQGAPGMYLPIPLLFFLCWGYRTEMPQQLLWRFWWHRHRSSFLSSGHFIYWAFPILWNSYYEKNVSSSFHLKT